MIPLVAMASLLAGAAYFGLPEMGEDSREDDGPPPADPPQDLGDGGLLADDEPPAPVAGEPSLGPEPLVRGEFSGTGLVAMETGGGTAGDLPALFGDATQTMDLVSTDEPAPGTDGTIDSPGTRDIASTAPDTPPSDGSGDALHAGSDDRLTGTEDDDRLTGGAADDVLMGAAGHDALHGGGGDNHLFGGEGSDLLMGVDAHYDPATELHSLLTPKGGHGVDLLDGGAGDDVLRMGHGDIGTGGAGDDLFFLQADAGAGFLGTPDDGPENSTDAALPRITDFDPAQDRLVLSVPFSEAQIAEAWPGTPVHDAVVGIEDFDDGEGATILLDGRPVAEVMGAQGIDPDLVQITGSEMVGPDLATLNALGDGETFWHGAQGNAATRALMGWPGV